LRRPELSKRWRVGAGRSSDRLGGSTRRGGFLRTSEAPGPPGATRGRTTCWSSRVGRAADRELEPTFFSPTAIYSRRDDNTSVARGGNDVDDPNMLLQSTVVLDVSPLHDGSGDGSSLQESRAPPPFTSCCSCCSDRAWRSRAPCAAPCARHAASPWPLCEDHVWFEHRWMVASLCDE
jgi:hypothetical protein